jgi:pimeloyl-ACP methyl ester carboxylesterase
MILIFGGYSYGSLVTTLLPDTESILIRFMNVTIGSAEAEIRLRALHLSVQWNRHALARDRSQRDKIVGAQEKAQEKAVVMGGEESEPGTRRPSKDSRRSIDNIRRSVDFSRRKLGLRHTKSGEAEALSLEPGVLPIKLPLLNSYYLLISPLRPPISALMTMFSKVRHHGSGNDPLSTNLHGLNAPDTEPNLVTNATLAVYGDKDFFTSQRKLRKWVEDLAGRPRSTFRFREIAGAGHFWQEEGVEAQLRTTIRDWLRDIVSR